MTVAVILLAYAVGVSTLGARMLARAGWTARAPLLGILTYLAAAWSMVAALVLGPLVMALAPAVLALALGRVPHA